MHHFIIILLINIFFINICNGRSIYVSLKGNDSNSGTIQHPFKSISKAISIANPNDTIIIRKGEYAQYKSINIKDKRNIVIQCFKDEKVFLTGGFSINKSTIKKITNKKILSRVKTEIKDSLFYIDLNPLNIHLVNLIKKGFGRASGPSWNELFIDYKPMQLARWPNDSMTQIKEVVKQGNIISKNITDQNVAIFKYNESNPNFWSLDQDIWIGGYFGEGWCDEFLPISKINKREKTIYIKESTYYGFKADGIYRRWYASNIIEELDMPSEYVLDIQNNHLYFYPPSKNIFKLQLSILNDPIINIENCQHITINNINIECSRGIGININKSNNITINNCIVRNLGHIGIKINGGINSYDNEIINTQISYTSAGGIILNGGDINTLKPGNNHVKNCLIYNFNRNERSYRPAIEIQGVGNDVSNVEIFNSPSSAIILKGNNHTIKNSNIHHVCQEVHDQGAIYYGRNPTERGHIILNTYFHEIGSPYSTRAIYHDDGACGMTIVGCIFNNIASTPIQIGGGQDIKYLNNIFMNTPSAIIIDSRLRTWANHLLQPNGIYDKIFQAINYKQPPFSESYPELLNYWTDDPTTPKRILISNNIFYNINNIVIGDKEHLDWRLNWSTNYNPGFNNTEYPLDGINYKLIKEHLPTFIEIPLNNIGCRL